MRQRLEQFLSAENLTKAEFADKIKVARAGISHIMSGRNNPGYDFIINTMNAFPELNMEWLLKGSGKMYKSSSPEEPTLFGQVPFRKDSKPAATSLNTPDAPSSGKTINTPDAPRTVCSAHRGHVTKIVLFYDDGTFEEFC